MSTHYCGELIVFGGKTTLEIMREAQRRLEAVSGKTRSFSVDNVVDVFFGVRDDAAYRQIGCRGLVLDDLMEIAARNQQFAISFSTQGGYPDYLARYLVDKIAPIDPTVKIKLDCVGDVIHKHKETILPRA